MKKLRIWLRKQWFTIVMRKYRGRRDWCMCGERIDQHTYTSNHAPVDAWEYARDLFARDGK